MCTGRHNDFLATWPCSQNFSNASELTYVEIRTCLPKTPTMSLHNYIHYVCKLHKHVVYKGVSGDTLYLSSTLQHLQRYCANLCLVSRPHSRLAIFVFCFFSVQCSFCLKRSANHLHVELLCQFDNEVLIWFVCGCGSYVSQTMDVSWVFFVVVYG